MLFPPTALPFSSFFVFRCLVSVRTLNGMCLSLFLCSLLHCLSPAGVFPFLTICARNLNFFNCPVCILNPLI